MFGELGITVEKFIKLYGRKDAGVQKKAEPEREERSEPSPKKEREERQEKMRKLIEEAKKDPVLRKEPVYNPF